ncbi:RimJ/RimL family protein N-acetyltransferase [Winogradskyella epiphytica]|uniref:RimJ/RimL family protein N-acetyltransferase n=1 Tax=Winogradskyella epiphytica TaxID=262005 RepID=A0A2V4WXN3_9FLAO|nr:GNAT family N-acetyltransferase [Winogradskyella epiphytica]PYE82016.1 RimJ/RimL family protein N-acetyltransferase [Winogradskyella epiphytica]GGW61086.1 N-acetyltransferase [Winogradskyella epiphytica]
MYNNTITSSKIIETERLYLRPITEHDTLDFFELDSNPDVHTFLGQRPITRIEQSQAMILSIMEQYNISGFGRLAIVDKLTDHFIGWTGLKYAKGLKSTTPYYDLGTRIKEQYWGKGYASEAAMASLEYGFKNLKLNEICAVANVKNMASNTILTKIGMQVESTFEYNGDWLNWYVKKNPYL